MNAKHAAPCRSVGRTPSLGAGVNRIGVSPKAGTRRLLIGEPVTVGKVLFYPVGGGRTGSGRIQADGTFVLSYRQPGDGVPVGQYKVAIISDIWKERRGMATRQKNVDPAGFEDGSPHAKSVREH